MTAAIVVSVLALGLVALSGCHRLQGFAVHPNASSEYVVLLHGLARSHRSMAPMRAYLRQAGYSVVEVGYPSTSASVDALAATHLPPVLTACRAHGATRIHFVTHSMGGILLRSYLAEHDIPELGRVVMLAPPNRGSEVVDRIGHWRAFKALNGPAGQQLGTGPDGIAAQLPSITFPCGVIAGDWSINRINSLMIPGPDDGKVAIARTQGVGETDHLVVHAPHPTIMGHRGAQRATLRFLRGGSLARP
ncbi:MAG: alpha/beta fold hydrolase [Planctomycetota bacterium]|jgi:triacylglycerol lipase|nr:alpha/beta fold hydrolase [Planctomycetota bacterium]